MRVILVRHAEAAPGEPDELRPLTADGRAAARALGVELAAAEPDAVVSSPLLRAWETARSIADAAGLTADTDERLAPGAVADDLRAVVADRGETVIAVGHQPDFGVMVLELTGRAVAFPPGGCHEVEL
jgi:phosphohistidine phosphatase